MAKKRVKYIRWKIDFLVRKATAEELVLSFSAIQPVKWEQVKDYFPKYSLS